MSRATIITDASVDMRAKVGAWAAWVKADSKSPATFSGPIKREIADSTDAEMCALANAMHKANAAGLIEDGAEVMLQSDSTHALAVIMRLVPGTKSRRHRDSAPAADLRRAKHFKGVRAEAAAVIRNIVARRGLTLVVRHVRGHQEGGGRQFVNRQVDEEARRIMRATRSRKQLDAGRIEA